MQNTLKKIFVKIDSIARQYDAYAGAVFVLAALILFFSIIPARDDGLNSGFSAHIGAYALFSFMLVFYLHDRRITHPCFFAVLLAAAYGILVEFLQLRIPYRQCSNMDMLINFIAACIGTVPGYILIRIRWM